MHITDIKPYPVWVGNRNQLIVKVETNEGIYGLGESGLSGRELAVIGALKHFREFLIGQDPMQRGRIWQELYRGQYFEGGRVLLAAQSAIDIALYDIAGKALGVPVYTTFEGRPGAVDERLIAEGRMRRLGAAAQLDLDRRETPIAENRVRRDPRLLVDLLLTPVHARAQGA